MSSPKEQVQRWVREAVIGLGLCPFAAAVYDEHRLRVVVSKASGPEEAVRDALEEAQHLLENDAVATTLVVFEAALDDFMAFLDAVVDLEALLSKAGADGTLQVATFHPDYRFDGTGEDDVENYTNRAPYPIFHLLRESNVSQAIHDHPDPEGIPARNIETMRSLGKVELAARWAGFRSD